MVVNVTTCVSEETLKVAIFYFNDQTYANNKEETIKGIIIDNKLSLYSHIKGLCIKDLSKGLLYPGLLLI